MRPWALAGLIVTVLVAGCGGSRTATTPASPDGGSSSTTSPTSVSTTSTTSVSGLRTEFLAWVAPVGGDEARLGWEAYELPGWRVYWSERADCWEENGFGEFAGHMREYQPDYRSASKQLLPDINEYREVGFFNQQEWTVGVEDVEASSADEADLADTLTYLSDETDIGIRKEDVAAISAIGLKCRDVGGEFLETMTLLPLSFQWQFRLGEIDREPEVAALIEGTVMPCLRGIGPEFDEAEDIHTWLATLTGATINLHYTPDRSDAEFQAALTEWGQSYAACIEPLAEMRRQPRLEAREDFVDEHFTELLQLQSDIDEFLAGN